ncbi:MAG: hypothetical protein GQF41_2959 [Candidatus Rifleibacterium amylolyticum]|nr:MAG: hypothetical protein GQF41_2959 [Candidatus Rifleibacterium amylolyticum]
MLKKFFVLFIVGMLAFTAVGCTIFGDFDDDDNVAASTTLVKTVIKKPAAGGGNILGNLKAGIKGQVTTDVVTGAVVTLTLANGSVFTMTDNGNGEYTATVSGLEGAPGFIIEARKGDLLVQNMVTDLANTDLSSPIESNHLTTAFAQVAISAANVLSTQTGVNVATLEDLIKNVTSITIDYSELKRQVTDEANVTYESSRNIVTVALANADENTTNSDAGASLLEKIISGSFTDLNSDVLTDLSEAAGVEITTSTTTDIWEEKVTTPLEETGVPTVAPATDKEAIDAAATTFVNAFLKVVSGSILTTDEKTNLSAVLSEDFIMNGMTKPVLLNTTPGEDDDLDRFEGGHSLVKINDNTYLIHVAGTAYLKTGGSIKIDSAVEGYIYSGLTPTEFKLNSLESNISEFPVMISRQTDGSWKIMGNRIKVDGVEIELQYGLDVDQSRQFTNFWLQLDDTTSFEVESVTVSGGNIEGTGVSLAKDATNADSNAWHYWATYPTATNGTVTHTSPYPSAGWTYAANYHVAGTEYTFTVKFKDGTTQTFKHKVPQIPTGYAPFTATQVSVTIADNKLKLTWPKNANAALFDSYYVSVWCQEEGGDSRLLEWETSDINTVSTEFALVSSSYEMISGKNYSVSLHSELKNGLSQHFHKGFTVPDQTEAAAVAMSQALNAGTQVVAAAVQTVNPQMPSAGSLRASDPVDASTMFPAGTYFYAVYTAYNNLVNVFSLVPADTAIKHQLMQFFTDATSTNPLAYPFTSTPAGLGIIVGIDKDFTTGGNVKMHLESGNQGLDFMTADSTITTHGEGLVTVDLNGDSLEVDMKNISCDVSRNGFTPVDVFGMFEADLYLNGEVFTVENQTATLRNGQFGANGLITADIMAGTTKVAALSRDTSGALILTLAYGTADQKQITIE